MQQSSLLLVMVEDHHLYEDIWNPFVGETLNCECKVRNPQDTYMVSLRKYDTTVSHVLRVISCICILFLRHGGVIKATLTGP